MVRLLRLEGDPTPGQAFLRGYERAVLLALARQGLVDAGQLSECRRRLETEGEESSFPFQEDAAGTGEGGG